MMARAARPATFSAVPGLGLPLSGSHAKSHRGPETGSHQSATTSRSPPRTAGNQPPSPAPLRTAMAEIEIKTAPADFRFPTTNQTRHCFTRYVEYHRCVNAKGDDAGDCDKFAKYYRSLCPGEWVEKWNEQRENGTFPGPL